MNTAVLKKYTIEKISLNDKKHISVPIDDYHTVLFFVGYTKTNITPIEIESHLVTNCYMLCDFIINNPWLHKKRFIYVSTTKAERLESRITHCQNMAKQIIAECKSGEKNVADSCKMVSGLVDSLLDVYGLTKLIGEEIVRALLPNYINLRLDYVFGHEEDKNIIAKYISDMFSNTDIRLPRKERGFLTYRDVARVLKLFIEETNTRSGGHTIYGTRVPATRLAELINNIGMVIHSNSKVEYYESDNPTVSGDNTKLQKIYKKHMECDLLWDSFEDEFLQIFYRFYIEKVLKYKVLEEMIGGSYAKVYKVSSDKDIYSIKISLGQGADNGSQKLCDEVRQLQAVQAQIGSANKIEMSPIEVVEMFASNGFTYVVTQWHEGKILSRAIMEDKSTGVIAKFIEQLCLINQLNQAGWTEQYDIVNINIRRVAKRGAEIEKMTELFSPLYNDQFVMINGKQYKGINCVMNEIEEKWGGFSEKWGMCISGDAIFDNFIVTNEETFKVLDPRGRDLFWTPEEVPLFYLSYDFAKMLFYCLGWKQIRLETFSVQTGKNDWQIYYKEESKEFVKELYNVGTITYETIKKKISADYKYGSEYIKNVLLLMGVHFLCDAYPRLCGKGASLIQCAAELMIGLIIVNCVVKYRDFSADLIWKEIMRELWSIAKT